MSNLHVNLDEANKHTPKGFDNAAANTRPWKDESSQSTYTDNETLPRALNFVDGTTAPPTTTNGHIYVITGTGTVNAGWGSASFNDWVRFSNGFPVSISPVTGYLCYDITASQWMEFDGSTWVAFGGGGSDTSLSNTNQTISPAVLRLITVGVGGSSLGIYSSAASFNKLHFRNAANTFNRASIGLDASENFSVTTLNAYFKTNVLGHLFQGLTSASSTPLLTVSNSSNIKAIEVRSDSLVGIGNHTSAPTAQLHVKGTGSTSGTTALLVQNVLSTPLLEVKDDGSAAFNGNLGFFGTTPIAQPTTAVADALLGTGGGTGLTDLDTFDGYTLQQVVRALRNLGILA